MPQVVLTADCWDLMVQAVLKVRERLLRATAALDAAGVPYAVIGGNAVAAWVAQAGEGGVRNTVDVDLLLRRRDFEPARVALEKAGFVYRHAAGIDLFLDGPGGKARDAVHIVVAGEKVRPDYPVPAPDVDECVTDLPFADEATTTPARRVLSLDALVRMKLTSFRDKDRTHLRDLAGVGTIDESWCERLPAELARRLREILDNPDG